MPDLLDRMLSLYVGEPDGTLLLEMSLPNSPAGNLREALGLAAALPISLGTIPGLEEVAAIETRLAPAVEIVFDKLSARTDADEIAQAAAALHRAGRHADVVRLRKQLVRLLLATKGERDRDTATGINALGLAFYFAEEFELARWAYKRALELRMYHVGERHPDTAITYAGLGRLYEAQGQYDVAASLHREALDIMEETLGPRHPDTAVSYRDLGCTLHAQGDFAGAQLFLEQALAIARDIDGPSDPLTAKVLANLAAVRSSQGEYSAARSEFEEALTILERAYGPDHEDVGWTLSHLGSLHFMVRDPAAAYDYFRRALSILGQPDSYATELQRISLLNNFVHAALSTGRFGPPFPGYDRIFEAAGLRLGSNHPTMQLLRQNSDIWSISYDSAKVTLRHIAYEDSSFPLVIVAA